MAKEKKTLKFQMMMSPDEAEVLDDWMFKRRVRSRAEAIRRLWQLGMLNDERRVKSLDIAIAVADASSQVTGEISRVLADTDISDEIKIPLHAALRNQERQVALFLYEACKSSIEIFPLVTGLPNEEAFKRMRSLKEKIDKLDYKKPEDIQELLRMMSLLYPKGVKGDESNIPVKE